MTDSSRLFIRIAALSGALAVALGAFGAHGLKPLLTEYQLAIYEKGVHYQFYHTLALMAAALLMNGINNARYLRLSGWFFTAGILCFSGSLYLLACRDIMTVPAAVLGPVTPLGGVCFIAGWVLLLLSVKGKP
ncbi:MAG: DUF423 domain-containing protein [Bacteroidota bacterium]